MTAREATTGKEIRGTAILARQARVMAAAVEGGGPGTMIAAVEGGGPGTMIAAVEGGGPGTMIAAVEGGGPGTMIAAGRERLETTTIKAVGEGGGLIHAPAPAPAAAMTASSGGGGDSGTPMTGTGGENAAVGMATSRGADLMLASHHGSHRVYLCASLMHAGRGAAGMAGLVTLGTCPALACARCTCPPLAQGALGRSRACRSVRCSPCRPPPLAVSARYCVGLTAGGGACFLSSPPPALWRHSVTCSWSETTRMVML
jgi:hypothetical protein